MLHRSFYARAIEEIENEVDSISQLVVAFHILFNMSVVLYYIQS